MNLEFGCETAVLPCYNEFDDERGPQDHAAFLLTSKLVVCTNHPTTYMPTRHEQIKTQR